jgi:peptidoglycan hydrolase CwlO-like protein|tara:strand:- start:617 stop:877 length:261 start_codon:yes stop_codon:yes gene_type:complete
MVEIKVTTSLYEDEEKLLKSTQDKLDKIEKQVQEMSYKISDLAEKYDHEYSRDTWNSLQNIASELDNFYITAKHLIETFRRDHINL